MLKYVVLALFSYLPTTTWWKVRRSVRKCPPNERWVARHECRALNHAIETDTSDTNPCMRLISSQ
eukprot:6158570-Amphidinium_carterae.1